MYIYTQKPFTDEGRNSLLLKKPLYSHVNRDNIRLTGASFRGQQTFAGPLGQQSIFGWPSRSVTDPLRSATSHDLLWLMATT